MIRRAGGGATPPPPPGGPLAPPGPLPPPAPGGGGGLAGPGGGAPSATDAAPDHRIPLRLGAAQDADGSFAQVQVLLRANDPFYELTRMLGGHRQENAFWLATLRNLAGRFGVTAEPTMEQTLVDGGRQWKYARNLRHNAAIRSGIWTMTHPGRLFRRSPGR